MKYTKAWLNYEKAENAPEDICVTLSERGPVADSIRRELELAFPAMYGVTPVFRDTAEDASLAVTFDCNMACGLGEEGYALRRAGSLRVVSGGQRGLLYGMFAMLKRLRVGKTVFTLEKVPSNPWRMLDHWDNLDGSIERGYSGKSFFFRDNEITVTERIRDYARDDRFCRYQRRVHNNVNVRGVAQELITERYREPLVRLSLHF